MLPSFNLHVLPYFCHKITRQAACDSPDNISLVYGCHFDVALLHVPEINFKDS
jgi:hypothetical protein